MNLTQLSHILALCWDEDTSADPDGWSPQNPAWGQCAITSLIVQDERGGELLRAINQGFSHYWNRLPDGSEVDLTREQFSRWDPEGDAIFRTRNYVLGPPLTAARYELLRRRVNAVRSASRLVVKSGVDERS